MKLLPENAFLNRLVVSILLIAFVFLAYLFGEDGFLVLGAVILVALIYEVYWLSLAGRFFYKMALLFYVFLLLFMSMATFVNAGWHGILAIALITMLVDLGGYGIGKFVGGPKLSPSISPNKTVSGAIGGIGLAFLSLFVIEFEGEHAAFANKNFPIFFVMMIGSGAIIGDLMVSWLKRKIGVKDTSKILGAHGGVWDRLDSHVMTQILGGIFVLSDIVPRLARF